MSSSSNNRKKKKANQFIFRGKSNKSAKSRSRKLLEGLIMLILGINLIGFLNTLPRDLPLDIFISSAWLEFSSAFIQIIQSSAKFGAIIIVFLLLVIALTLILGGFWRLFSVLFLNSANSSKRSDVNKQN